VLRLKQLQRRARGEQATPANITLLIFN
jgi:hypothetical protein